MLFSGSLYQESRGCGRIYYVKEEICDWVTSLVLMVYAVFDLWGGIGLNNQHTMQSLCLGVLDVQVSGINIFHFFMSQVTPLSKVGSSLTFLF